LVKRDLFEVGRVIPVQPASRDPDSLVRAVSQFRRKFDPLETRGSIRGLLAEMEGHGGIARLSRVTGVSRTTILHGQRDLVGDDPTPAHRVRRPGGGRKRLEKKDPD